MAGMTPPRGRRGRDSIVPPAVAADAPVPAADVVGVAPAAAPVPDAAVLPDPTIVAEPDAPRPLVTASPPLAAEPDAVDVAQAELAAANRGDGAAGSEQHEPHDAVAGQSMLVIDSGAPASLDQRRRDVLGTEQAAPFAGGGDAIQSPGAFDPVGDPLPPVAGRVTVIEVVGPPQGRRRAGFAFGPEPRRFLATSLTDEQLTAIRGDRLLAVGVSEVDHDAIDWSRFA